MEFIIVSSFIIGIGLFFVIFERTKAGQRFFDEAQEN